MKEITDIHFDIWNIANLEGMSNTTKTELIKAYLKVEKLPKKIFYEVTEISEGSSDNIQNNPDISILMPLFNLNFDLFKEIVNKLDLNLSEFKKYKDETPYLLTYLLFNEHLYIDEKSELKKEQMDFLLDSGLSLDSYLYINNNDILGEKHHRLFENEIIKEEYLVNTTKFKIYLPDFIKCNKPDIIIENKEEYEENFFYSYLIDKVIDQPFVNKNLKNNFLNYFWETLGLNLNVTYNQEENVVNFNNEKYHRLNTILKNENEIINNIGIFIEDEETVECLLKQNKINIYDSVKNLLDREKNNKYKGTNKDLNYKYHDKVLLKDFFSNVLISNVIPKLKLIKTDVEIVKYLNDSNKLFNHQTVNEIVSKLEKEVIEKTLQESDTLKKNIKNRL